VTAISTVGLRTWRHFCVPKDVDTWLERGWPCGICGDAERRHEVPQPQTSETPEDQMDQDRRQEARRNDDVMLALQKREIEILHAELKEVRAEIDALKADREKAFRWGIGVLGSAVLIMGSWMWTLVSKKLGL
jgi:hypothetical protein